jgi:hypothetical protein
MSWRCGGLTALSSGLANRLVQIYFPKIAERYKTAVEYHKRENNCEDWFGIWFNMCVNGIFRGQQRVHTIPHTDHKNVVGVCLVLVYEVPGTHIDGRRMFLCGATDGHLGANFDHRTRSWLVIWEAGVILEMPPWVAILYPSSLFCHFNVDVKGMANAMLTPRYTAGALTYLPRHEDNHYCGWFKTK